LLAGQTSDYWVDGLSAAGVPCARVNDLGQALADEHVRARRLIREASSPRYGGYLHVSGPVPQLGHSQRPAPALGEHTEEILGEIGSQPHLGATKLHLRRLPGTAHCGSQSTSGRCENM
jgi:CoA:oxalate CoA-transferase